MSLLLDCLLAYFIGAIPFGVIVCRSKGIDIFKFGSGNPGATNVSRAVGKPLGALVFLLDVLKGLVPALIARQNVTQDLYGMHAQAWWFVAGLCAVLGHCYSVFLRFRGGKGIATSLGAGLGASPAVAGSAFGIFFVLFGVTRYVSLASIAAAIAGPIFGWVIPGQARELVPVYGLLAVFVVIRHRANIRRLLNGTEPKFESKKKSASNPPLGETDPSLDERRSETGGNPDAQ
ncbi:glycerol-3-phosphate 1-O-acyltransferase PlsY [Fimbriimonas ginsengisoli]|uniref:Glycerol-3-phosphate acyltransferase n=1 Tax=Fimbriimonas ginsengisoli Gsoil 348 TaxID=661478 RepID=A0A068NVA7_FIMGI|nr:glycerol-3-phosphate 1-O-acyltransferase PlsY [Fimbriimonas ginsengisoli]AIE86705.1 Acyl-phosphate:glycerol-3-phosphate O-acyltransferase PlsY [Fimbriimonas ginsengisoli Gsoil 348]